MKMRLSEQEVQDMLKCFKSPHFTNVVNYITAFETDPDWVKEVLPAPLEPAEPIVSIALSEGDQFHGLIMGLQAKYGDLVGDWGIAYVMDTDLGVIFGRESLAEPKKLGVTTTEIKDGVFTGTVSRWGQELLRIEANVGEQTDEDLIGGAMENFHFKYSIKADGSGITDVDLIRSHFDVKAENTTLMTPTKIELNESPFDIYGEVPVGKVVSSFFAKLDMVGTGSYLARIPGEDFLPYAFFKHDDYRMTMDVA